MTIIALREKQQEIVAQARGLVEQITDRTSESRARELNAQHDRAMAEYDRLEERINHLEMGDRRPRGEDRTVRVGERDDSTSEERYARAFDAYVRGGDANLSSEQRSTLKATESRAQNVGTGTQGGYLAPAQFQAELVKSLKIWGPMLDPGVTRVLYTATGTAFPWPTLDDTGNEGALLGENQQVSQSEVTFGTKTIDAYKYTSGVVLVSGELLQDAAISVDGILSDALAERLSRIGNKHMTTGDGANKPRGIVTAASTGATAAAASAVVFDDFINLEHSLDPAYRVDPSVRWMFNDNTLKALRKLKDGDGRYIWQPADARTGPGPTILDHPYSINQAMADIGTTNRSVIFGAMNRYIVRIVRELAIKRLVERYADYDQVGFLGFARMDGELMDANAIKALSHP